MHPVPVVGSKSIFVVLEVGKSLLHESYVKLRVQAILGSVKQGILGFFANVLLASQILVVLGASEAVESIVVLVPSLLQLLSVLAEVFGCLEVEVVNSSHANLPYFSIY